MKTLFTSLWTLLLLFLCVSPIKAQEISTIQVVQGNTQFEKEILYYYNNNWRLFRMAAYEKNFISSYDLIKTPADSLGSFELVLITKYPDSTAYKMAEENFRPIMNKLRPNGPVLLNEIKRDSMLKPLSIYEGISLP